MTKQLTLFLAAITIMSPGLTGDSESLCGEEFHLELRTQRRSTNDDSWQTESSKETWNAGKTAVIVCDVWDKHHCLNAVRRLEEFAPRMNDVLREARLRGATIIHSPSDCMPAYEDHPARHRAMKTPGDKSAPADLEFWCSKIPAEEQADYPIDQSDGGEDDDPVEHAKWAAELTLLGRNPGMPWKSQSSLIEIDAERDYISDRGDEVWNILTAKGIDNVILVGVHTNMCVLGRPFGLRQMVRNGKNVVLMRDMTDCMYNPKRWPYVDHFSGNDLIISHVERYVCATVTSDQLLGGEPFHSKYDVRTVDNGVNFNAAKMTEATLQNQWTTVPLDSTWKQISHGSMEQHRGVVWIRCTVRLPTAWLVDGRCQVKLSAADKTAKAWINGVALTRDAASESDTFTVASEAIVLDDINLLVIRMESSTATDRPTAAPAIVSGEQKLSLDGRWQIRLGDNETWSSIPLPAKFGMGSDLLFEPLPVGTATE